MDFTRWARGWTFSRKVGYAGCGVAVVTIVEGRSERRFVGYGGLPNEEGEVELDASVMHGPTHRAGSVASVRRIKNVSRWRKR